MKICFTDCCKGGFHSPTVQNLVLYVLNNKTQNVLLLLCIKIPTLDITLDMKHFYKLKVKKPYELQRCFKIFFLYYKYTVIQMTPYFTRDWSAPSLGISM